MPKSQRLDWLTTCLRSIHSRSTMRWSSVFESDLIGGGLEPFPIVSAGAIIERPVLPRMADLS